ncbi:hypothetical protein N7486_010241 [Penicillium sp. IBT 16267x]|nr:hypothetical protein N7486_010241 [Penicillium sp. IBT 16267x]
MASQSVLFERLRAYSFQKDPEFANGLAIILGHPHTPATETEISREDDLVLQAKCFFFSRKENISPSIDFTTYKSWLNASSLCEPGESNGPADSSNVPDPEQPVAPEPTYPSSFAHIVELITTGQPIPGIEQIPDTVLTGHDIASEKPRRRKPWEKDELEQTQSESTTEASSA